jgi:hypothetical protein
MTTPDDAATIMQRHERHMETPRDSYHRPRAVLVTGRSSEAGRQSTAAKRG